MRTQKHYDSIVEAHATHCPDESYSRLCKKLRKGPVSYSGITLTRLADGRIEVEFDEQEPVAPPPVSVDRVEFDRVEQLWQGWIQTGRVNHWRKHLHEQKDDEYGYRHESKWWLRRFSTENGQVPTKVWADIWERHSHEMNVAQANQEEVEEVEEVEVDNDYVGEYLISHDDNAALQTKATTYWQKWAIEENRVAFYLQVIEKSNLDKERPDPYRDSNWWMQRFQWDMVGFGVPLAEIISKELWGFIWNQHVREMRPIPEAEMEHRYRPRQNARGQSYYVVYQNAHWRKPVEFCGTRGLVLHRLKNLSLTTWLNSLRIYLAEDVNHENPIQKGSEGTFFSKHEWDVVCHRCDASGKYYPESEQRRTRIKGRALVSSKQVIEQQLTHSQQQQAKAIFQKSAEFQACVDAIKESDHQKIMTTAKKLSFDELAVLYIVLSKSIEGDDGAGQPTPVQQPQANAAIMMPKMTLQDLTVVDQVANLPVVLEGSQPSSQPVRNRDWLTVKQLSELLGISEQAVKKNIKGEKYLTRQVKGSGGPGGLRYEISAESIPEPFRTQWYDACPAPQMAMVQTPITGNLNTTEDVNYETRMKKAQWIEGNIKPIIRGTEPRSTERARRIDLFVQSVTEDWNGRGAGKTKSGESKPLFSKVTVYNWINAYEQGGILGLMRKERADRTQKRILISRPWDAAFIGLLTQEQCQQIADELTKYIASLWAAGAKGSHGIQLLARRKLEDLTRQFIPNIPPHLVEVCEVSRPTIDEIGSRYRLIALKDRDAKKYHDIINPRVIRDWSQYFPNDIWIGDVRPLDIRLLREDGREVYPRTISWYDVATHIRIDVLIQCEPGEGVKQTHVALAFIAAVNHLGLPKRLYLDNGKEYNFTEMLEGFNELNRFGYQLGVELGIPSGLQLADSETSVTRALPYNASAKPIEGSFAVWAKTYEPCIQGYVGGERTKKLRAKVGGQPHTYEGNLEELHTQISIMLNSYHKRPQSGHLKGKSPIQAFNDFVAAGWKAIAVDPTALALAMSEKDTRLVSAGGVVMYKPKELALSQGQNVFYHNPEFSDVATRRISIRALRHDPSYLFALHPVNGWKVMPMYRPHDALAEAGIDDLVKARRHLKRVISERRGQVYRLDLVQEWEKWNETQPDFVATPFAATIEGNAETQEMKQQLLEVKANQILETLEIPTPKRISSRWQSSNDDVPKMNYADE